MRKLIVNADGFGFTYGINKGILESVAAGIVTSTSCNVNFPYIDDVVELMKQNRNISIGLHLNVNVGKSILPASRIPSLLNSEGEFLGEQFQRRFFTGKIKINEIEMELDAQIRKLQSYNVKISHLDGHQNKHLYPGYFDVVLRLGKKHGIKRIRCHKRYLFVKDVDNRTKQLIKYYLTHPQQIITHSFARFQMIKAQWKGFRMADRLITPAYIDNSFKYNLDTWITIIKNLPEGINEIYCHPGYADTELCKYAKYVHEREIEVKILTDPVLKNYIADKKIKLISFNEV